MNTINKITVSGTTYGIVDTDTKVTSAANHYTPSADSNAQLTATLSGTAGAYAKNTEYTVLTGVKAQRDAKGHVTGLTYTAQKIKDTDTDTNTTYKLNINGTEVGGGTTSLGTVYAPTSAGTITGQVVQWDGSKPVWKTPNNTELLQITSVTAEDNSSCIGVQITVDGMTQTWNGSTLVFEIPAGEDDTITVSGKTGYEATITKSPTGDVAIVGSKVATIYFEEVQNVMDFGLTVKWATGNIIKNGSTYSIGSETDAGAYFAWGETVGYNQGEGHSFDSSNYQASSISNNLALSQDAARVRLGSPWRMPTQAEFLNLIDNTTSDWVTNYNNSGVAGRLFTSKTDSSKKLFFPAVGFYDGTSLGNSGTDGYYWSTTYNGSSNAYYLRFNSSNVRTYYYYRYYGMPVRPVQDK